MLARGNAWGYTRILGELKKLGVGRISRTTVLNILREAGLDPGPKRGQGTWTEFLAMHAETLYACDFFTKNVWTFRGLKQMHLLAFIHIEIRRVFVSPPTANPVASWVAEQATAFVEQLWADKPAGMLLMRDNDGKFQGGFDERMKALDVGVKRVSPRAPNMNAYIERGIQTVKSECLDLFIVLGEKHLRYIVGEFVDLYNTHRPHRY